MESKVEFSPTASDFIGTDPGPSGEPLVLKRQRMDDLHRTSLCDATPLGNSTDISPSAAYEPSVQERALSIYVVLKNIFSNLNASDLRSCSKLCNLWDQVASPLFISVEIDCRPCHLHGCKNVGRIMDNEGEKSKNWHGLSWQEITEEVEKYAMQRKVFIALSIGRTKLDILEFSDFLDKYGNYVSELYLTKSRVLEINTTAAFLTFISSNFPNLVKLALDDSFNLSDTELEFQEVFRSEKLRTIDFGVNSKFSGNFISTVLTYAVNCSKVKNYPVEFVECLANRNSIHIHSVSFPPMYNMKPETAEALLNKLSAIEPKLVKFNWMFITCSKFMKVQSIRESINKIIESSKDTMKRSLIARPAKPREYVNFPIMSRLHVIVFEDDGSKRKNSACSTYFQPLIDPAIKFPNVITVFIDTAFTTRQEVSKSFPRDIFKTFGSRIVTLETCAKKPECIEELAILFPNVKTLQIQWSSEMSSILDQVYKSWKCLNELELLIHDFSIFSKRNGGHCFDAALSGLDGATLADLKTGKKVMKETLGTLSNLTQLEKLWITILDKRLKVRANAENFITTVIIDYVKCHVPELQIFLRISKDNVHLKRVLDLIGPVLPYLECVNDGYGDFEDWDWHDQSESESEEEMQ